MHPRSQPLSLRGRWLAIIAASAVYQFSYWPLLAGTTVEDGGGVGLLAFGLGLVPFVFLTAAFASRHPNAAGATLRAMGWFLLVGLPLGLMLEPILGTAVGVALGSAVALAPVEGIETRRVRYYAVVGIGIYLTLLVLLVPGFAIISAAVLPIAIHGVVDQTIEERHLQRQRAATRD